jgi:hypothetical protein
MRDRKVVMVKQAAILYIQKKFRYILMKQRWKMRNMTQKDRERRKKA